MKPPSGFLCLDKGISTEVFFPDNLKRENIERAKQYCNKCLRKKDCLNIALKENEEHGIFGGMTYNERCNYLVKEALKAGKDYSLLQNTLREQQHLEYATLSSPPCNVDVRIHIPLVLEMVAVGSQSSLITLTKFV